MTYLKNKVSQLAEHTGLPEDEDEDEALEVELGETDKLLDEENQGSETATADEELPTADTEIVKDE